MASIFNGLKLKIDAILLIHINHLDLSESGATLTDRWVAERSKMQIGSRVDSSYGFPYQNTSKVMQGKQYAKTENKRSEQEDVISVAGREVCKPWISMGAMDCEVLAGKSVFFGETEEVKKIESGEECHDEMIDEFAQEMLVSESTSCTYPASDTNGEEIHYITCYTEEGIFCKKAGLTNGYEWSIPFESKEQYNKVIEFIGHLSDDEDLRFTANENFWKDFLKGDTDVGSLKEKYTILDNSGARRTEIKASNFKEYATPNYKFVPEPTIGKGGMRILKNGQSVAVFSVDDLKIRVDEQTGTRVLISEIPGFGNSWYDAIPVDAELENGLAEAIGVDDIPEVELEGYYIGTHSRTGIQYVMRPGDEGRGGKVLLRNAADVARYNALAEEYYTRYPNLIESQEEGRIWASFEILGMAERTDTGIVRIGYDGVSYNDNFDYTKNWSIIFTEATWELLNEWLKDNRERMIEWDKFGSWGDVFDKIGSSYERIWSDEELKQGYLNN